MMKLKNIFNSMGFSGQLGKLGTLLQTLIDNQELNLMQAKAYTDLKTGAYNEPDNYYFTASGLSDVKPTGNGSTIEFTLNTTERLLHTFPMTIVDGGVIDKDNMYSFKTFWESLSTSRYTFLRFRLTVNDNIVLFDHSSGEMNNSVSDMEYGGDFVNRNANDITRPPNSIVKFEIYGRVSSGTDTIRLRIEDVNKLSGLYRSVLK